MKSALWVLATVAVISIFPSCKKDYCVSVIDPQGNICCERCFDTQEELDLFNSTYTTTTCAQKCVD